MPDAVACTHQKGIESSADLVQAVEQIREILSRVNPYGQKTETAETMTVSPRSV